MHSGDMNELGGVNLTDAEREALLEVMQRAKVFDEKAHKSMNSRLEGQLQKWTNALKGWQPRWLSVDQQQGVLHYYTSEDRKKCPPRGSLHLWGAVIAPSDEDSQTFSVNGANGEVYKLRGSDAKERQYWVSRLRNEVERCTSTHGGYGKAQVHVTSGTPTSHTHSSTTVTLSPVSPSTATSSAEKSDPLSPTSSQQNTPTRKHSKSRRGLSVFTSRASLKKKHKARKVGLSVDPEDVSGSLPGGEAMLEVLTRLQKYHDTLNTQLESCSGTGMEPVDRNVLLLKATSQAAVHSVKDCVALVKLQQASSSASGAALPSAGNLSSVSPVYDEALVERRLTQRGEGGGGQQRSERPRSTPGPMLDVFSAPSPPTGSSPQPLVRSNSSSQASQSSVITSV